MQRDPGYADAWAVLAHTYLDEFRFGYGPRPHDPAALAQAESTARHAVEFDPNSVQALLALHATQYYRGEFAELDETGRRLLSLNSTNPEVLGQVGWHTARARDWDRGVALVRQAIDRSVKAPWSYHLLIALDHYRRGEHHAALAEAEPFAEAKIVWVPVVLAAIHGQLGNKGEARRALDRARAYDPGFLEDPRGAMRIHYIPEDLINEVINGLGKAGLEVHAARKAE